MAGINRNKVFPPFLSRALLLAAQGSSFLALFIGWELLARSGAFSSFLLPSFSSVLRRVIEDAASGALAIDLGQTVYRTLAGFAIAAVLGIALGLVIARVGIFNWFFDPLISIGFPMPKIAFLPIFMLWFGLYDFSKISMIVFNAIFPVIVSTIAATLAVEKELVWSARSLGARPRDVLWEIVLPAGVPQILTGLQVALPTALIVAIVTEMMMGGPGIGGSMIRASRFADSPGVFAGIVEIALAGWLLIKTLEWLRRRLLSWHEETQRHSSD